MTERGARLSRRRLVAAAAALPAGALAGEAARGDARSLALAEELSRIWDRIAELDGLAEAEAGGEADYGAQADSLTAHAEALGFELAAAAAETALGLLAKFAAVHDRLEFAAWLDLAFEAGDAEEAIRASLARDLRRLAQREPAELS